MPLKLVRRALYQCIEDLAAIWADMTLAYFGADRLIGSASGEVGATSLGAVSSIAGLRPCIEIRDADSLNSSVALSILDKLLDGGHITLEQYLKKLPKEYIEKSAELIGGNV